MNQMNEQSTPKETPKTTTSESSSGGVSQSVVFSVFAPLFAALIALAGTFIPHNSILYVFTNSLGGLIIPAGFVTGIVTLILAKKRGDKTDVGWSIAGICINGIIMILIVLYIIGASVGKH